MLSWVLNAYTIVFAPILVPAGRWADRAGRRRVLLGGLGTFVLGSLLCGIAPGVGALIAARVIQAAGAGLMVPASLSLLLPAQLLGGAGVGLTIPSLLAAGSSALTPARFGTGSGILNMARQIGTVLGVAGLVAVLSYIAPASPVAAFRHGLILIIAFFAAAGVASAALLTARSAAARPAPDGPAPDGPATDHQPRPGPGQRHRAVSHKS